MKKVVLLITCFVFFNCFNNREIIDPPYESRYKPIIIKKSELNKSISIQDNVVISKSAKIYIVGDYIFINDQRRGFHIFDNSDPSNPVKKRFLEVPGATDVAIRNNMLYINQARDLVALTFDFNNFTFKINKRLENVFPEVVSPDGDYEYVDNESVVVNWIEK